MKTRSKSIGIVTLQQQLSKQLKAGKNENFISFVNERRLGKLISNEEKQKQQQRRRKMRGSLQQLNFKNFRQIYNRQRTIQNARYSQMTRKSEQPDLISERTDWKVNRVRSLANLRKTDHIHRQSIRECCTRGWEKMPIHRKNKFDKIDEDVYKKIALERPGDHIKNPETTTLFRHYVEACEMNQNIRRLELTTKRKY